MSGRYNQTVSSEHRSRHKTCGFPARVLAVFALVSATASCALFVAEPEDNGIGIAVLAYNHGYTDAEVEQSFEDAAEMGATWTRVVIPWFYVEPSPGEYNWESADKSVATANEYGLNVLIQVTTAPEWATGADQLSEQERKSITHGLDTYAPKPEHYKDYAEFFAEVVKRYSKEGVKDYEVWNEPGSYGFWKESFDNPVASPESYAQLLKETYPAAHKAYRKVNVIAGGQVVLPTETTGTIIGATEYLARMYEAGAQGYFDSLSHHPYGLGAEEWVWNGWDYMFGDQPTRNAPEESLYSLMEANGDGDKKIWITEVGQDTPRGSADEDMQKKQYTQYLETWAESDNVGPIIFYHIQDKQPYEASENNEDYFGVVREDGSWKPAAWAIKSFAETHPDNA